MSKLSVLKFAGDYFFEANAGGGVVAVYQTKLNVLRIQKDCPEMGIYRATQLPYLWIWNEMIVIVDNIELGFAKAVELDRCAKCVWATGHSALPCTVNPMSYGTPCYDYETK